MSQNNHIKPLVEAFVQNNGCTKGNLMNILSINSTRENLYYHALPAIKILGETMVTHPRYASEIKDMLEKTKNKHNNTIVSAAVDAVLAPKQA